MPLLNWSSNLSVGVPAMDAEHQALVKQVVDFKAEYDSGKRMLGAKMMKFLGDWVRNHIQTSDQKYGVWSQQKVGV